MNQIIIKKLTIMQNIHTINNDNFRSLAYQKAIDKIKYLDKDITSVKDIKNTKNIGESIKYKINEIIKTNDLKDIHNLTEKQTICLKFLNIYGIGIKTCEMLYSNGYRSIDDLKNAKCLTKTQKIGIKYYDALNERIPRSDIDIFKNKLEDILDDHIKFEICGSYRRLHKTSHDIDVLITSNEYVDINDIVKKLYSENILVDDLTYKSHDQKYMGICKINGKFRHIDIIVTSPNMWAYNLLYFTGSSTFNRKMRYIAKKRGYTLSNKGIVDKRTNERIDLSENNKIIEENNKIIEEKDIFNYFDMKYLEPQNR